MNFAMEIKGLDIFDANDKYRKLFQKKEVVEELCKLVEIPENDERLKKKLINGVVNAITLNVVYCDSKVLSKAPSKEIKKIDPVITQQSSCLNGWKNGDMVQI